MKSVDYYQILGVERRATPDEIRDAFRRLAKKHHPDVSEEKTEATLQMQRINAAYKVLQNREERRKHDAQLRNTLVQTRRTTRVSAPRPKPSTRTRNYSAEQKESDRIKERIIYHVKGHYETLIEKHPMQREELTDLLHRQIAIVEAYSRSGEDEDALWRWAEKAKGAANKIAE